MLFWLRLWHLTFGTPDGSIYASTGGRPFPAACLAMELKKLRLGPRIIRTCCAWV